VSNSLHSIEYGRWGISSDRDATRTAYARLTAGSPEECGCEPCLNFVAHLEHEFENFSLGFRSRVELMRKPFKGFQLVQLEFTAQIPCILEA